jgi:CBS-domain-containing membrane protein
VDVRGVLCGIVTSLDVLRAVRPSAGLEIAGVGSLPSRRVGSVMRPGVITLEPTDPILAVVDLVVDTRFHVLPVVRRDARGPVLIGVVPQRLLLSKLFALSRPNQTRQRSRVARPAQSPVKQTITGGNGTASARI